MSSEAIATMIMISAAEAITTTAATMIITIVGTITAAIRSMFMLRLTTMLLAFMVGL